MEFFHNLRAVANLQNGTFGTQNRYFLTRVELWAFDYVRHTPLRFGNMPSIKNLRMFTHVVGDHVEKIRKLAGEKTLRKLRALPMPAILQCSESSLHFRDSSVLLSRVGF